MSHNGRVDRFDGGLIGRNGSSRPSSQPDRGCGPLNEVAELMWHSSSICAAGLAFHDIVLAVHVRPRTELRRVGCLSMRPS